MRHLLLPDFGWHPPFLRSITCRSSWQNTPDCVKLLGVLAIASPANYLWIVDYRARLASSISFVRSHSLPNLATSQSLEQARWANAKILAIIVIILSVCSQFSRLGTVASRHRVPVLGVVVSIFIALFDAALDLDAEWTVSLWLSSRLTGTPLAGHGGPVSPRAVNLAVTIWHTNQFRQKQIELFNAIHGGRVPVITFSAFSSTAQPTLRRTSIMPMENRAIIRDVWLAMRELFDTKMPWGDPWN